VRRPRARHDPGRVLVDLAVALADGATTISEIAVLGDQETMFGPVASDSTCWRLLDRLDDTELAAVAAARARAREVMWAQHAETHGGRAFPPAQVAGRDLDVLVIDLDASIVVCHSKKEQAAATFKGSFGYHPLGAFCDNTREALAAILRRGNAGANTAADHIIVLDQALAQIPDAHRHGTPILIRTDTAGCTKGFLAHIRAQRALGVGTAKDTGLNHFPSRTFAINQAWLSVVMLALDLLAWTQHLLLHGDLAKAEPKTLRYRLLHVAARIIGNSTNRGTRRSTTRLVNHRG
jgi:hypothetical protein